MPLLAMLRRYVRLPLLALSLVVAGEGAGEMLRSAEAAPGRVLRCGRPLTAKPFRSRLCRNVVPSCSMPVAATTQAAPAAQPAVEPLREFSLFNGRSLDGWEIADEHDFYQHGPIDVQDDVIRIGLGSPHSGIRYVGPVDVPRINYELSFDAQRVNGGDFFGSVTFPIRDEYCTLIVGGWSGQVIGLSNVNGDAAVANETTTSHEFQHKTWYTIRLRVTEDNISAWIDDEQKIDLPTEGRRFAVWWEIEPLRPLGIGTWYTGSELRNIRLKLLDSTQDVQGQ